MKEFNVVMISCHFTRLAESQFIFASLLLLIVKILTVKLFINCWNIFFVKNVEKLFLTFHNPVD